MTARQEAARLLALLEDPAEIETRPIAEIGQVLELLGADPAAAVGRARRRIAGAGSAAGALLARIAEGEETDRQIAELGAARLEDVRARLQEAAGLTAVPQAVNGLAHAGSGRPAMATATTGPAAMRATTTTMTTASPMPATTAQS
jgi:hypothetical protein